MAIMLFSMIGCVSEKYCNVTFLFGGAIFQTGLAKESLDKNMAMGKVPVAHRYRLV